MIQWSDADKESIRFWRDEWVLCNDQRGWWKALALIEAFVIILWSIFG